MTDLYPLNSQDDLTLSVLGLGWKWLAFPKRCLATASPSVGGHRANLFTHPQCSLPSRAKVHDTL